jgi:hypothetical protein
LSEDVDLLGDDLLGDDEAELEDDEEAFVSLLESLASLDELVSEVVDFGASDSPDEARPFADDEDDDLESLTYQPLPLKTMPTG